LSLYINYSIVIDMMYKIAKKSYIKSFHSSLSLLEDALTFINSFLFTYSPCTRLMLMDIPFAN